MFQPFTSCCLPQAGSLPPVSVVCQYFFHLIRHFFHIIRRFFRCILMFCSRGAGFQPAASGKGKKWMVLKHCWNFWNMKFQRNSLIISNVETLKGEMTVGNGIRTRVWRFQQILFSNIIEVFLFRENIAVRQIKKNTTMINWTAINKKSWCFMTKDSRSCEEFFWHRPCVFVQWAKGSFRHAKCIAWAKHRSIWFAVKPCRWHWCDE